MRIDHLRVENFKGFKTREISFHPQFNLVVGVNGSGKSSLLDALAIALGSWYLGIRGIDSRPIRERDVRLRALSTDSTDEVSPGGSPWELQWPCEIEAAGKISGRNVTWKRTLRGPGGRTTQKDASQLKHLAVASSAERNTILPLIANYGTGRLWNMPPEDARVSDGSRLPGQEKLGRLAGYRNGLASDLSVSGLVRWIARQSWITFQNGGQEPSVLPVVRRALIQCLEGAEDIYFDAVYGEVIIRTEDQKIQPFNNLSDGQRTALALAGDIATRAATLNPQLQSRILELTPGVVLIDELDLHLHPRWQRRIIEDLRNAFPKIQFVATTHSPILIQSLRSGEELLVLDGEPTAHLGDKSIAEIVQGIQGVSQPDVSLRYASMKRVARSYLEILEEAKTAPRDRLAAYKERLQDSLEPYADNPAFQAFLEMKRAASLGD